MGTHSPALAVIVPTYGRPGALEPLVEAFAATTNVAYRLVLVLDADDHASWETASTLDVVTLEHTGTYPQKVNAGIAATQEPFMLVGADDIRPHAGWFENARAHMTDRIGFVSLNDLGNGYVMEGYYATLPLVARWYTQLGPLFDETFHHNGVDVDASLTARARGAFAYAPDAVMEHLHPLFEKGEVDDTYRRGGMNEANNHADRQRLLERWGPELEEMGIGAA